MRELTTEIKAKIRLLAIERLQDGNALLVVDADETTVYCTVLETLYKNSELEIE